MQNGQIDSIHTIVISGLGVMGASLALAIKQNIPRAEILGYDKEDVVTEALQSGIIDKSISEWPQDCKGKDIVFLCTPLGVLRQHLEDLNGVLNKSTIVTDVGSTKLELQEFAQQIQFSGTYVGGHPMTGAEKSGLRAANPLLFENAVYVLTKDADGYGPNQSEKLISVLQALKARIMFLPADVHDKILAAISHLPQLASIALVNLVGSYNNDDEPYFDLAAGGFRDLTRIASSSIDIWQDIISSNKENIQVVLKEFISILQRELQKLDNLKDEFDTANDFRSRVPKQSKGFLSPLKDILVYVTDEVGVVAKIANALSDGEIDIRDIELLKIREKEGGVFRLSLNNEKEALEAIHILNKIGYKAFIRE